MENEQSRRNFLKLVLGGAGIAGLQACTHRNDLVEHMKDKYGIMKDEPAVQLSDLDQTVANANDFINNYKSNINVAAAEDIGKAAQHYLKIGKMLGSAEDEKKLTAANEVMQKLYNAVHQQLEGGEGLVHIVINGYKKREGIERNEGWEYTIPGITAKSLAESLEDETQRDSVMELVATTTGSYKPLPEETLHVRDVKARGYLIERNTDNIGQLVSKYGPFPPADGQSVTYTQRRHQIMSGTNTVQGVYNADLPAALKLEMTKTVSPGYEHKIKKDE